MKLYQIQNYYYYLVEPQILVNSMKSIDFNENMGFKSTVF
jgi:hypothetical protein